MAKKQSPYTEQWLLDKGYTKQGDSWVPSPRHSGLKKPVMTSEVKITTPKHVVVDTPDFQVSGPKESFLTIDGIVAGLNGSAGLMRGHWTKIKKQKELYQAIIREQLRIGKIRKHAGPVKVQYIGYKSSFMDWDNFCASFKHIGDSLVKEKIILEDNPKIIVEFLPLQYKCKRSDQKVIVIITDVIS